MTTRKDIRAKEREVLAAAQQSGDRAYAFVPGDRGELLELRIWPDGQRTHTRCDTRGVGIASPRRKLVRAGGLRAQRPNAGVIGFLAGGGVVALVALIA